MSGHNKWSKIKHKKAVTDAKRSKIFSKLVKLIQVEAKKCDGDINSPGLKTAIDKARKENMPNDNIERAIKKASDSIDVFPVTFEAYGPGGVGLIITGLTDNNNRTSNEIKNILSKNGASFGSPGSVSWNFSHDISTDEWEPKTTINLDDTDINKLDKIVELLEENDDIQNVFTNAQ